MGRFSSLSGLMVGQRSRSKSRTQKSNLSNGIDSSDSIAFRKGQNCIPKPPVWQLAGLNDAFVAGQVFNCFCQALT